MGGQRLHAAFGGFLLLGGRLGDLHGQRRLFLAGIGLFSAASLACGLAQGPAMLIAARAVQGLGGAVVSAVALSLIMNLFSASADDTLGWHWIFLVNLPIGGAVVVMVLHWLPRDVSAGLTRPRLDVAGAVTVTLALMLAVLAFLVIESRVAEPLMPLSLFSHRNLTIANLAGVLWAAAMFAWFFISALRWHRATGWRL